MSADTAARLRETDGEGGRVISVVVPAYNEQEVLAVFQERLRSVLEGLRFRFEILYVNDGSTDNTSKVLERLKSEDDRIAIIDLSRNYGKEIAMTAGLDHAVGAAVVVIDADLQDPPELIPTLVARWVEGYDNVYGKRMERSGESLIKKATAYVFYRSIRRMTKVEIPADTGDFRLLSRRAVEALKHLREQHRFMKGLLSWVGYRQVAVPYKRDPRHAGETKWNYWRLWNYALEGITSFTIAPLKLSTYVGLVTAATAFVYAVIIIYKTLAFGEPVRGYPSLMVVILFLGGVQLMSLGVIGEYIGRIFNETKRRPLYLVDRFEPSSKHLSGEIKEGHAKAEGMEMSIPR